eukprot:CAMPEP_0185836636 /NCGR_PEP_ID=MMETSP1353-20130828/10066_1 /TAXON_ID=1077150 /ORGANISM="Erythrolobus australicus, Strain CCMP3124" /LENGTH=974 /DNA_ID=CAMNT_0028535447 /DNA_START=331 /DNA_END=3255 /DNA_ORIENTATION=-
MGALFRSEEMVHLRLYFDRAAARETVEELGDCGVFEFTDLNDNQSAFQRAYAGDVKRCDEILRALTFLESEVSKHAPQLFETSLRDGPHASASSSSLHSFGSRSGGGGGSSSSGKGKRKSEVVELEQHLATLERSLLEMNAHYDSLSVQLHQLIEMSHVLEQVQEMFRLEEQYSDAHLQREQARRTRGKVRASIGEWLEPIMHPMSAAQQSGGTQRGPSSSSGSSMSSSLGSSNRVVSGAAVLRALSMVAGVIETSRIASFERFLFRATRGNTLLRFEGASTLMTDPVSKERVHKTAFAVFFTGEELHDKVAKIARALGANMYGVPSDPGDLQAQLDKCEAQLRDVDLVVVSTERNRLDMLEEISKQLQNWKRIVIREKAIFHTLNLLNFDTSARLFVAEGWCAVSSMPALQEALEAGRDRSNAQVSSVIEERPVRIGHDAGSGGAAEQDKPPTHFKLNRFTEVFHGIVESYGVAEYREVNPAPFLVITFPFLFAVMFGDIGHGVLMALAALILIVMERRLARQDLGEMLGTVYNGRYIIFLMGAFSIYTGFIYNECFALPLDLFGTRWKYTDASTMACGIDNCADPAAVLPPLKPYPFGFDPVWKPSQTALLFFNSYKMKLSIVLGVSQMMLGLVLSAENARFFRRPVDFFFEFVPQVIFLLSIFGYLVFLIFFKWLTDWTQPCDPSSAVTCEPPDLKAILIGMIMSPGSVPLKLKLYPAQSAVQGALLLAAVIAVPWMLFPKPLILRAQHRRRIGYCGVPNPRFANDASLPESAFALDDDTKSANGKHYSTSISAAPHSSARTTVDGNGYEDGGVHDVAGAGFSADDGDLDLVKADASDGAHAFDFSEVMVHQGIHTIEFVLGAVSNTASYLRLWALSLAHAELSDVFLEKLLIITIETKNPLLIIIGFVMWAGATIGVLMLMESLSAFLHALRLHWVEFQNKFYNLHGSGRKFAPFSLAAILAEDVANQSR